MNAEQRQKLKELYLKIDEHRANLEEIRGEIEEIKSQEEEKLDNLPDSLRESSKGEVLQDGIYALESSIDELEQADTCIYAFFDYMNEIVGDLIWN